MHDMSALPPEAKPDKVSLILVYHLNMTRLAAGQTFQSMSQVDRNISRKFLAVSFVIAATPPPPSTVA